MLSLAQLSPSLFLAVFGYPAFLRLNLKYSPANVIKNSPCQNSESIEKIEECIESHVYRKEEIFESLDINAVNLSSWEDYYSFLFFGKCFFF